MSTIQVDVVNATELIYSGKANCVFVPAVNGELGIYPNHTALLSTLKPGEVRVETEKGLELIYVSGGIIEVQPDIVTILSDTAMRSAHLDENKVMEAKKRAEEAIANANTDQDLSATQAALVEAIAQLQILSRIRKKK